MHQAGEFTGRRRCFARLQAEDFRLYGSIGSHLEHLERNDGWKGFNQPGIDGVRRIRDPRKNLVHH